MRLGTWSIAALAATIVAAGSGCIIRSGTTTTEQYQNCRPGTDTCAAGSACVTANAMPMTSTQPGTLCTSGCLAGGACPSDAFTNQPGVCVDVGGNSQCYRQCGSGCPTNQMCLSFDGTAPFCVPSGGGVACGANGQVCCEGGSCTAPGNMCGADGRCALPAACGQVDQPCCAGNTCTAAGAACASTVSGGTVCVLTPYAGCPASSEGAACGTGRRADGTDVATACQRAQSMGGTGAFCTAACNASMAECPVPFGATAPYNCYRIEGATTGQCFLDCGAATQCPTGTTCRSVTPMGATGPVQICTPL